MSFFSRTPQYRAPVGVLDIAGGSVGATLFAYTGEQGTFVPRHNVSVRYDFPFNESDGEAPHIPEEALENALHALYLGRSDLNRLRVFFSPPHGVSHLYIRERVFDAETTITKELVHELLDEAFTAFKKNEPKYASLPELYTVEGARVNGYSVETPIGMRVRSISLSIAVSAAPSLSEAVSRAISKIFSSRVDIEYYAEVAALPRSIIHAYPGGSRNFLAIAIGDTYSTISTVWHGLLIDENAIPLGKRSVIERVARALNVAPPSALIFLRDSSQAPKELSAMLPTVIVPIVSEWTREFNTVAQKILESRFVPETVYLISDEPALLSLGTDALKDPSFMSFTFSTTLRTLGALNSKGELVKTLREGGTYDDMRLMLFAHFCASIDEAPASPVGRHFLASNTKL